MARFRREARALCLALLAAACLTASARHGHAEPSVFPTGVTRYDPQRAYNEYVLFSAADGVTHLIDMDGNDVHTWSKRGVPSVLIDPALIGGNTGHVLVQLSQTTGSATSTVPGAPTSSVNRTVGELDWDGKIVWEWGSQLPGGAARQHHDIRRLANGHTLVLADLIHTLPGFRSPHVLDDVIYDVAPDGQVVWQWQVSDHLDELGLSSAELQLIRDSCVADCFHLNNMTAVGPNKWFDAGDQRFSPDNILVDSRDANFIIIIDRKTGRVVWKIGPDYGVAPKAGGSDLTGQERAQYVSNLSFRTLSSTDVHVPRPVDQISGQHDAHIIAKGLPGAGDLLVFDNQGTAGYPPVAPPVDAGSRVLEIDPVTKQIVWQYSAASNHLPGWTFHSPFISSARRLPNGNTLIDEGINGRFFQVTPGGDIVWEYVSPFVGPYLSGAVGVKSNWVYRAQPVPYDWVPSETPRAEKPIAAP